jgi:hypothetical protein
MKNTNHKRHWMSRILKIATSMAIVSFLNSCTVHENTRQISPSFSESGVSRLHTFYVRKHADDDYKLGEEIAEQLQQMGYRATCGTAQSPPGRVDAVVSYMDRWVWDITMYMLSLDVQLREPGTDTILATTKTVRSSLIRKTQQEMIRETLTKLFKNQ